MALLTIAGLSKRFGATLALDGATLEVADGEIHALVGENGAGKSTLVRIAAGVVAADAGDMRIAGRAYAPSSPSQAREAGVALVHQELSLFPHLSVAENILIPRERRRWGIVDAGHSRQVAGGVLGRLGRAEIDPDQPVESLSIAARQVVEICRAVVADARILLLDEPTSSLPRADVERLFAVMRQIASRGVAVVYISHALEEVREIASRVTVMRDGRTVATRDIHDITEDEIVALMAGRQLDRFFPERRRHASEEVALDVRNLASPPGLLDASFTLRRGEIFGVAGLVGSGRSTLVRSLFGLVRARDGIVAAGSTAPRAAATFSPSERIAAGVGYLSEDRRLEGLALAMSVADNATLSHYASCSRGGWIDTGRQLRQAREVVDRVAARAPRLEQPARELSGGNQQKVALARLLHQRATILLLDEPTRGIDVGSKAQIYEVVAALADEGCAVLLVSSSLPELFGLCDRIAVMRRGRLLPARVVGEWTEHAVLEQALGVGAGADTSEAR
ncbi:MAG TPA: sugar ABC transporter ATP-binding protein [Vicinamibacterales bacterium]|nr:sugar ABC transporter ATP-binding protein [Vicinamibacterales bacterium]